MVGAHDERALPVGLALDDDLLVAGQRATVATWAPRRTGHRPRARDWAAGTRQHDGQAAWPAPCTARLRRKRADHARTGRPSARSRMPSI